MAATPDAARILQFDTKSIVLAEVSHALDDETVVNTATWNKQTALQCDHDAEIVYWFEDATLTAAMARHHIYC